MHPMSVFPTAALRSFSEVVPARSSIWSFLWVTPHDMPLVRMDRDEGRTSHRGMLTVVVPATERVIVNPASDLTCPVSACCP
jgi:hypothetical protein